MRREQQQREQHGQQKGMPSLPWSGAADDRRSREVSTAVARDGKGVLMPTAIIGAGVGAGVGAASTGMDEMVWFSGPPLASATEEGGNGGGGGSGSGSGSGGQKREDEDEEEEKEERRDGCQGDSDGKLDDKNREMAVVGQNNADKVSNKASPSNKASQSVARAKALKNKKNTKKMKAQKKKGRDKDKTGAKEHQTEAGDKEGGGSIQ